MNRVELGSRIAGHKKGELLFQGEKQFRIPFINYKNKDHPKSLFLPHFLIVLRIQGREKQYREFMEILDEQMNRPRSRLPHITLIPVGSISAERLDTRNNENGLDMNRAFIPKYIDGGDQEVANIAKIVRENKPFDVVVTGHQDGVRGYLYHQGKNFKSINYDSWRNRVGRGPNATKLLNGIDDPSDATLGSFVNRGLVYSGEWNLNNNAGFLEDYVMQEASARAAFTLESPVTKSALQRDNYYRAFFDKVLFPVTEEITQANLQPLM